MPTLTAAPSPATFAKSFTRGFAAALRTAAGKDERLSTNEATKVVAPYTDNAVNFLAHTGQKSVSVEKLISSGYKYAFALADKAAGPDGRVSLADADKLPADLKADYMKLRGRLVDAPSTGTTAGAHSAADIAKAEAFVTANLGRKFPELDDGEMGVSAFALSGAKAQALFELAKLDDARITASYDPAKQMVVALRTTNDEETLFVSLVDKATGKGKILTEIGVVDLPYNITQAQFEKLVPGMSGTKLEDADHYDVIDALVKGAKDLAIG
jgi:hypothetical protein